MSFDGECSKSRNRVGIVLVIPDKTTHPHAVRLEFPCMNNEAEYEALIQGMILTQGMKSQYRNRPVPKICQFENQLYPRRILSICRLIQGIY
jgi:hypothetical protein